MSLCVTGPWRGVGEDWISKDVGLGFFFVKESTEGPLPPCGGQGQAMRARECVGLPRMACTLEARGFKAAWL